LAIVFALAVADAQVGVYWAGNLTTANKDYEYRSSTLAAAGSSLIYTSVDAQYNAGTSSGGADVVSGAVFAIPTTPLYEYLMYYASSASYTAGTVSYSGSSSMVGASYLSLTEVDGSGNQLSTIPFSSLSFNTVFSTQTVGALQYATFTGTTLSHANFVVSLTFITSSTAGQLTTGAVVTPKSLELTMNVQNYPFQNSAGSSLVLTVAVGIANGQQSGSFSVKNGQHLLTSGTGQSGIYFSGAASAIIDANGTTGSVSISTQVGLTANVLGSGLSALFQALATAKAATGDLHYSYQIVNFTLPQSANITYDPNMGYSPPNTGANAAAGLSVQYSLLVLCFIMLSLTQL